MSGTSVDGIDLALLETDGENHIKPLGFKSFPYTTKQRDIIKSAFGLSDRNNPNVIAAKKIITDAHINALKETGWIADLIGFHGQTIFHDPDNRTTLQIGDGEQIAKETGIKTVYDFRSADVSTGGQGAPLLPLYHQARLNNLKEPTVILNIGGVANVTWIHGNDVLAFDTGPGNALIDDHCLKHIGKPFDKDGALAMQGTVDQRLLKEWLGNLYFQIKPPKSLDRDAFINCTPDDLTNEDALATLTAFTAQSIATGAKHFPRPATEWYVTGGGRHNKTLIDMLKKEIGTNNVQSVEILDWNGDALEAEGFAYLAVRSVLELPLSLPNTTGCKKPMSGGKTALP